jgi:hypothetical protein
MPMRRMRLPRALARGVENRHGKGTVLRSRISGSSISAITSGESGQWMVGEMNQKAQLLL